VGVRFGGWRDAVGGAEEGVVGLGFLGDGMRFTNDG